MPPIEVIYEKGVFRPLQPVELPDGAVGEVLFTPTPSRSPRDNQAPDSEGIAEDAGGDGESPGQRAYRLLMEIAAFPHVQLNDRNDVGEHHDDFLYPKRGTMP